MAPNKNVWSYITFPVLNILPLSWTISYVGDPIVSIILPVTFHRLNNKWLHCIVHIGSTWFLAFSSISSLSIVYTRWIALSAECYLLTIQTYMTYAVDLPPVVRAWANTEFCWFRIPCLFFFRTQQRNKMFFWWLDRASKETGDSCFAEWGLFKWVQHY